MTGSSTALRPFMTMDGLDVTTYARVRVTVDIPITQGWGPDCKLEQVYSKARARATIVGEPVVTTIILNESLKS
jgi:hypothetical protein